MIPETFEEEIVVISEYFVELDNISEHPNFSQLVERLREEGWYIYYMESNYNPNLGFFEKRLNEVEESNGTIRVKAIYITTNNRSELEEKIKNHETHPSPEDGEMSDYEEKKLKNEALMAVVARLPTLYIGTIPTRDKMGYRRNGIGTANTLILFAFPSKNSRIYEFLQSLPEEHPFYKLVLILRELLGG